MYYKITDTLYINTDPQVIAANEAAINANLRENAINHASNAFEQILSIV